MSDPNPEDTAEALDEDELGDDDVVREDFPPDRLQGVDRARPGEEPDELPPTDEPVTGLLDDEDDPDEEVAVLGDEQARPSAEEAAVHEE